MKIDKFRINLIAILICGLIVLGSWSNANARPRTLDSAAVNILKGPYLIYSGVNTEMTVLWQTDREENSQISWGLDKTYSSGTAHSLEYSKDHQHKFDITGLAPGSKYYYRVAIGLNTYTGSFLAAPPSNATAVEFFAYGDTRSNPDRQNQVCGNIMSACTADPGCQTFILHVGDWVEKSSEAAWASQFFNRAYTNNITMQANLPIQGCRGNHEGSGTTYAKYWPYPYVADHYWSFDYGPAHIAVVDEYTSYSAGSAQLTWLENDLASSTKKWKFIMLHNPGWSAGSSRSNSKDVQAVIQPLCEKYGVQIVFGGHHHYYARAVVNGVQHLTLGTGGAPVHKPKSAQPYVVSTNQGLGYCKISISGNTLDYEMFSSPADVTIDSFTITLP